MAPLVSLIALLLAADVPGAVLPLRVVSDIVECPAPAEVQTALRQTLGDAPTGGWTLWYGRDPAAPAAERAASLLMELVDPAGERLTTRRIPTPAGDCAVIGTAMAAVVERSLRDLGWTRGEPLPESAWAAKPVETSPEKPSATVQALETANPVPRLVLGAGPLFATTSRLGINLLLDARLRVAGPLCLRLGAAALSGDTSETVGTGKVSLSSRTFSLGALVAAMLGPLEVSGGPVAWVSLDQASSSDLPKPGSGTRAVVAVGVDLDAAWPLGKRWRVGIELAAARVAFAPAMYVDWRGLQTTVLTPSPWQGMAAAKLEFVPWP
jgi:hypothetical protein